VPVQVPAWQVSVCVQASASLHDAPLAFGGLEHVPVAALQEPAVWHWSGAAHVTGFAPVHVPDWQESACVQAFPSSHNEPLAFAGLEQMPVAALQVPTVWHWSGATHATGLLPVHTPTWHVSVCEHALPSLQLVPSDFAGLEHTPVALLQVPAVWHWSGAAQVIGLAPVHVPAWHVSIWVQALPSLHEAPLAFAGLEQMPVPELQVPAVWHWSGAAHVTGLAPVQVPA
jgi:hypothetical protein